MNYLNELLGFYHWLSAHPLPGLLHAYWHLLMYYNNKSARPDVSGSWYWPVAFKVPNSVVMAWLGLDDRRKVMRQRSKLIEAGLVTYEKDTGNRAGWYRMVPFDRGLAPGWAQLEKQKERTQVWTQTSPQSGHTGGLFINNALNHKHASLYGSIPDHGAAPSPEAAMEAMKRNVNSVFGTDIFKLEEE
ncbi:restriction endonuclease subunit S [Eubacterium sp. 1001713B170207_170306_E7]|uniref:restriction endonuclease subunit S n=1 Tax=Eubacterium sp. 1001713B170207_170306_E7 TaxID=2787097 RepID=UPI00189B621A|nr:restriction endonuclease subunit S [Eubacterium sp. 1001713B170207_170306_E7]